MVEVPTSLTWCQHPQPHAHVRLKRPKTRQKHQIPVSKHGSTTLYLDAGSASTWANEMLGGDGGAGNLPNKQQEKDRTGK
ncbi:MAG: hypothetical protein CL912_33190 [Deltaproteobacteria bacterium]|nr:hypothetical protein [Deltaproteobacteria bacterium]